MKEKFDYVSARSSQLVTRKYSTSFSLGILFLNKKFHQPIYSIYGFVRCADEIVDSFHGYNKKYLLEKFCEDTYDAIENKISLNPILNSFQQVVHEYKIDRELIDGFLHSMEMDLQQSNHNEESFKKYILGSAEVVGLMCLRVFTENDFARYEKLKPSAMKLGAAFQKVNFLRDLKQDYEGLGRTYFPEVDFKKFTERDKQRIELEIEKDFQSALQGIKLLPHGARSGVYLAYYYYKKLFEKIRRIPAQRVMRERIRIPNTMKIAYMFKSYLRNSLNLL